MSYPFTPTEPSDLERRAQGVLCELGKRATQPVQQVAVLLEQRRSPCAPPMVQAYRSPAPGMDSRQVCVTKAAFRHDYKGVGDELLMTPCACATKDNRYHSNGCMGCSRSHQWFNNLTRNCGYR